MAQKAIEQLKSECLVDEIEEQESEFCIYETDMNEVVYFRVPYAPSETREEREQQRQLLSIQIEESRKLEQSKYEAEKLKQDREREEREKKLLLEFKKRCGDYPFTRDSDRTIEDSKLDVEPFDNEMGAVFTEDMTQEHAELRKQSKELSHYLFCQSMFEHKDENRRRSAKKIFAYHDVPLAEAAEKYLKKLLTAFSDDSERVNFLKSLKMNDEADEDLRKAAAKML
jgi:hypothetical protein